MLAPYGPLTVLDPFAGTGRVHELRQFGHDTFGVEIEPIWAALHQGTVVGNALHLKDAVKGRLFQAVVTSPCYGNRLADCHHNADSCKACSGNGTINGDVCKICRGLGVSMRRSYTFDLRRMTGDPLAHLAPDNAGALQWGPRYKEFHARVWAQIPGLLIPPALFLLNIKDHIRNRARQPVTDWHVRTLRTFGFEIVERHEVKTAGLRFGSNRERCPEELILMRLVR